MYFVSKASRGIAESVDKPQNIRFVTVVFPTIIIDGKLFETFLDNNNDMCVLEADSSTLLWRNPIVNMPHTVINILTKENVENFAKSMRQSFEDLLEAISNDYQSQLQIQTLGVQ